MNALIAGIERYQASPYRRRVPAPPAIWRAGAARLLDYGAPGAGRPAVLVIPSLVNRAYVLDLHPERSLMRWLAARGLRPMLLDWGRPGAEERSFDLSAYHARRLVPAAEAAAKAAGGPVALLGYCMGGAYAAALAARRTDLVSRLALIGAPWDFGRLEGLAAALCAAARREGAEAQIEGLGQAFGAVPVAVLQTMFAALDPTLALRKFRRFADLPEGGLAADLFVATEDWLNDGPMLSAPVARDLAVDWYAANLPARGRWRLDGAEVRPEAIAVPALAFCSVADRIAPSACAEALPRAIPGARILRPVTGHVGMIVGGAAEREVWRPLAAFLGAERDAGGR